MISSILSQIHVFYGDLSPDGTFFVPFAGSYKKYKGEDRGIGGIGVKLIYKAHFMDVNNNPDLNDQDIFTRWSEATFRKRRNNDGLSDDLE